MSVRISSMVWRARLQSTEKLVLLYLADKANDDGEGIWPSVDTIGAECGLSDRTARRQLGKLEEYGILAKEERPGRTNMWRIDKEKLEGWEPAKPQKGPLTKCQPYPGQNVSPTPAKLSAHPGQNVTPPRTLCHPNHKLTINETSTEPIAIAGMALSILRENPGIARASNESPEGLLSTFRDLGLGVDLWIEVARSAQSWCAGWRRMGRDSTSAHTASSTVRSYIAGEGRVYLEKSTRTANIAFPGPANLAPYFDPPENPDSPWRPRWDAIRQDQVEIQSIKEFLVNAS